MAEVIGWESAYDKALSRARHAGKLVLVDFFAPG